MQELSQVSKMGVIPLQDYRNDLLILGNMCLNHCEYEAAMTYFEVALKIIHSGDANDALGKAKLHLLVGTTHKCKGNFEQAKNYHAHALDIHLKQLGPEHVYVADSYNNLGTVNSHLSNFQ